MITKQRIEWLLPYLNNADYCHLGTWGSDGTINNDNDFVWDVQTDLSDAINLIDTLREVVGIAAHPDAYENWEAMLADAISALPTWILENDGSQ